jgi:hypothetical protein
MPSAALQFPSGRGSGRSFLSQLARDLVAFVEELASAIAQAREMAADYHALAQLSDIELAKRGLTREAIARFVVLGRRQ